MKLIISLLSQTLLSQQYDKHPIFILKDVKFQELRAMMDYMYRGEVNISQDQLAALLKAAESLQIKGLSDSRGGSSSSSANASSQLHKSDAKSLPPKVSTQSLELQDLLTSDFIIFFAGLRINNRKQKTFAENRFRRRHFTRRLCFALNPQTQES
jgi:hypothetical protein